MLLCVEPVVHDTVETSGVEVVLIFGVIITLTDHGGNNINERPSPNSVTGIFPVSIGTSMVQPPSTESPFLSINGHWLFEY